MQIKFNRLYHTYFPKTPFEQIALRDVNFEIEKGKVTAIIGHTGSGKSTLVQHINGLLLPTSGSVEINGYKIENSTKHLPIKEIRKQAGMVFQFPEYQLFEENCFKDIAFGPKNYGISEDSFKEKAIEILKKVGLDESFMERSPFELSGGQKRRVAIAGILALEPDILILDEPTAGLDPTGSNEMLELFSNMNKFEKKTIILVTHDMSQVLKYADNVVVLNKGKVIAIGTPIDIFTNKELLKEAELEEPEIIQFANELINNGLKIDIKKVKDIETLTNEIVRVRR